MVYLESHDEMARINGKTRLPSAIDNGASHSWYAEKRATLDAAREAAAAASLAEQGPGGARPRAGRDSGRPNPGRTPRPGLIRTR